MAPQIYPCPNPINGDCVMLHSKGRLKLQIELELLIRQPQDKVIILDYLPGWANCIHNVL